MEILLFFVCIILFFTSIILSGYNLIHPSVLFSGVWTVSSFALIFNYEITHEKIRFITFFVIVAFNLIFVLISLIATEKIKKKNLKCDNYLLKKRKNCIALFTILLVIYVIASLYIFKDLIRMASQINTINSISDIFRLARYADTEGNVHYTFVSTYLMRINIAAGVVFSYMSSKYHFLKVKKDRNLFITLFFISLCFTAFSAARNQAIMLITSFVVSFLFNLYYYSKKSNKKMLKKTFFILLFSGISFILLFIVIGTVLLDRMNDGTIRGVISSLLEYISGPISALNYFLNHQSNYSSPYFGAYTFTSFNNILFHLGIYDTIIEPIPEFLNNGYWDFNAYTIYFRYLIDFGFIGAGIMISINALIYGIIYRLCYSLRKKDYIIPTYSILCYGIVMSFFEEKIFTFINWYIIVIIFVLIFVKIFDAKET